MRESHAAHEGEVFGWDDPPASTGHPGSDVNCRCVAIPVIEDVETPSSGGDDLPSRPPPSPDEDTIVIPEGNDDLSFEEAGELAGLSQQAGEVGETDEPDASDVGAGTPQGSSFAGGTLGTGEDPDLVYDEWEETDDQLTFTTTRPVHSGAGFLLPPI